MKLLLSEIPEGHGRIERRQPAGAYDLERWVRPTGDVHVILDTDRRGQQITFRGTALVDGIHDCARCLKEFTARLEAEILVLSERRGSDDPRDEEALEQAGEVLYHEGVEVDLGAVIREAVILEVPLVLLCRPDCRGLCPQCGQDRNEHECGCGSSKPDPRWDQLKSLKNVNPEEPR